MFASPPATDASEGPGGKGPAPGIWTYTPPATVLSHHEPQTTMVISEQGDHFTVNDTHFAFGVGRQSDGSNHGALLYKLDDPSAVDLARSVFAIEVSDGDSTIIAGPCTLADDEDNLRRYNIPNHGPRSPPRARRRSSSVPADQERPPVSASVPVYHYDRTLELGEDPDDGELRAGNAIVRRSDEIPREASALSSPSSEDSGESSDGDEDSTDAPIGVSSFRPGGGFCEGTWFGVRRAGSDVVQTYYAPAIPAPPGQEAQDPSENAPEDASLSSLVPTRLPFIVELLQSHHERLGPQAGDSRQLAVHVRSLSSNGSARDFTVLPRFDLLPTDAGAADDVPSGQNPIDSLEGDTFDLRPECRISDIQVVPVPKDFDGVTDLA